LRGHGLRGFSEQSTMDTLAGSQDQDKDTSNTAYVRFHSEIAEVKWAMTGWLYNNLDHHGTDQKDIDKFLHGYIGRESDQFTAEMKHWLDVRYRAGTDRSTADQVVATYRSVEIGLDNYIKAYKHMDSQRTLEKLPVPADPPPTPLDHASKPEPRYHPEVLAKMAEEKLAADKQAAEQKKLAGEEKYRQSRISHLLTQEQGHVWYLQTAANDLHKQDERIVAAQKEMDAAHEYLKLKTAEHDKAAAHFEIAKHKTSIAKAAEAAVAHALAQKHAAEKTLHEKEATHRDAVKKWKIILEERVQGYRVQLLQDVRNEIAKLRAESAAAKSHKS
jgi:hypothetical protein